MKHKVATYCRVDQGGSEEARKMAIQMQDHILDQYIKKNNLQVFNRYYDIGYAGYGLERPDLQKLILDYNSGQFEIVLITDEERLVRGGCQKNALFPFQILTVSCI